MEDGQTTNNLDELLARPHISTTDEADLRWYFSVGRRQIEGSSNFGAMLDRMEHYGTHTKPCLKCGGRRAVVVNGVTEVSEQAGSGFVWSSQEGKTRQLLKSLGLFDEEWKGDLVCPQCHGWGLVPNKRRSKCERAETMAVNETRSAVSDDCAGGNASMARLGHISRLIGNVRSESPRAAAVLEAFYSPGGESEACLWHFTPAGKTMLRKNNMELPERQFFENERNRQKDSPNKERELLFRAADSQAAEMRRFMVEVWAKVRG